MALPIDERTSAIAAAASATADAAREAVAWFEDPKNQDKIGSERAALAREFRRAIAQAKRLEIAAARPMCVGVFGPSQAGKSYLVSVLARPVDAPLMAVFEGRPGGVDFIREINPEGGRESTGLVTRFTLKGAPHPPGFPVCLRLLSQADIVKILGNSFFLDGDPTKNEPEPQAPAVRALLDKLRGRAAPAPVDRLSEEDVWDIQEYFEQQFAGVPYQKALAPFWEEAAQLAPRLGPAERTELFAVLWGGHQPFSQLYRQLLDALARLGHPEEAYCPLDALIPRKESIIDVATLAGLGQPDQPMLAIRSMNGTTVELPRPVVTALTAELRIVVQEKPWPFFDHTDLLDFPGARSRQPLALKKFFEEKPEALKELFLRGKVAYLFDRYVAEQELTSMLLCIDDKNQEVVTLPHMIDHWITATHGATPAERAKRPCVLYFVLTKFDMHFAAKAGEDESDYGTRFANRLHTSLLGFFGKAHDWPKEWTPKKPFANCFWLRNPNFPAEAIIKYDPATKRELSLREDKLDYVERLHRAHGQVPEVVAHFGGSERAAQAWNAAMALNDGGIGFLADSLAPVCNPAMKLEQVAVRLEDLRERLRKGLDRFYVADDVGKRLEQRLAVADRIVDALYGMADLGRFGHLLRALQVEPGPLTDLLYRAEIQPAEIEGREVIVVAEPLRSAERPRPRPLPGRPNGGSAPAAQPATPAPITLTRDALLASAALRHWTRVLHGQRDNVRLAHLLRMEQALLGELTGELIGGAQRVGLERGIAEAIRRFTFIERSDEALAKAGLLAATLLNRYVSMLGLDAVPPEARPQVPDGAGTRPIFAPRPVAHNAGGLGKEPEPYTDRFVTDWVFGFVRLVEDNAKNLGGRTVDVEQNLRLGRLLDALAPAV